MYISKYFFVVIVAVLISTGSALQCYNCYSGDNSDCANLNSKVKPVNCDPELLKDMSAKMAEQAQIFGTAFGVDIDIKTPSKFVPSFVCQKVVTMADGKELVARSCQISSSEELSMCTKLEKQLGNKLIHCSFCNEEGCNAAVWLSPVSTVLFVPAMALIIWTLLF